MSDVVRVEVADGVGIVTLDRPDKLNAVSGEVFSGLAEAGRQVERDDDVRAVLLRGEGRAFCAGLDLTSIQGFGGGTDGDGSGGSPAAMEQGFPQAQAGFVIWAKMAKPVVSAVQGYALGAGFQLAIAADICIAAEGATLSVFEITYGLVPDLGGTWLLPRLVGASRAKELTWTARRFSAAEAERWGVVSRVVPDDRLQEEAMDLAKDLASRPPLPIRYSKRLIDRAWSDSIDEGFAGAGQAQVMCLLSNDVREAVAAAFEKRPGSYTGT